MDHKFVDLFVSREKQFSVGIDECLNKYYVSFPVPTANRLCEYEVYFELPLELQIYVKANPLSLEPFVIDCRCGKHFDLKFYP